MAGQYRKVFIDSRWRIAGEHNNFTIELPNDVDTTRTSTVYLCSASFSNTFETIVAGVNDKLYCIVSRINSDIASAAIANIAPGKYTGALLAAEIQTRLRSAIIDGSYSVTFDDAYGKMTFSSTLNNVQFPSDGGLRSALWKSTDWDPRNAGNYPYEVTDPQSINSILFFPRPSSMKASMTTGNIDLVPYREVYLHSSITQFRTLKCGTAEKDCLCRIPLEADYGFLNVYRHLGPSDALSCSDQHMRTITFSFRDWKWKLVPIDQPVALELVFLDTDPYSM
jgi:hypothetical protein